jgi:hypothetical protein
LERKRSQRRTADTQRQVSSSSSLFLLGGPPGPYSTGGRLVGQSGEKMTSATTQSLPHRQGPARCRSGTRATGSAKSAGTVPPRWSRAWRAALFL